MVIEALENFTEDPLHSATVEASLHEIEITTDEDNWVMTLLRNNWKYLVVYWIANNAYFAWSQSIVSKTFSQKTSSQK